MHAFVFSSASRWLCFRTNTAPMSRIQEEFCPQELQESLLSYSAGRSCGRKATAAITMPNFRQYSYVNCCCFSLMWYSSSGMHAAYSSFSRSVTSYQAALGGRCPFPSSSASPLRSPWSCAAENQKFSSSDWNYSLPLRKSNCLNANWSTDSQQMITHLNGRLNFPSYNWAW